MDLENENAPTGFSLPDFLAVLQRRRAIILQAFVLIAVVGCVQALLAKNVYQASAKLLVEGPSYNLSTVDSTNPLSSLFEMSQQQTVDTQVEVLQAAPLLDQVEMQAGTAAISVAAVGQTNVIGVTAESGDPKVAAAAPNTLLKLFIAQDVENRLGEMEQARQFVLKQGAQARGTLRAAESKLKRFKQQSHIAELSKNRDDQIARVNALAETQQKAQSDLAALLSQIASSRRELARQPATTLVRTHTTNTVIAALNDQNSRTGNAARRPGSARRTDPASAPGQSPGRTDRSPPAAAGGPAHSGNDREHQPQCVSPIPSGEDRRPRSAGSRAGNPRDA